MMNPSLQNILEIISTLAESERVIARLYRCCAETWTADEAFWLYLAYVSLIKQVVTETQFHKDAIEKRLRECIG